MLFFSVEGKDYVLKIYWTNRIQRDYIWKSPDDSLSFGLNDWVKGRTFPLWQRKHEEEVCIWEDREIEMIGLLLELGWFKLDI